MAHRAAALLQQAALDRKTGIVEIRNGSIFARQLRSSSSASTPCSRMALPRRYRRRAGVIVVEVEHAALRDHGIEVEILLQPSQSFIDSS
jgi:hypothetical protein